jgi:chemotaxis response regulator CheB
MVSGLLIVSRRNVLTLLSRTIVTDMSRNLKIKAVAFDAKVVLLEQGKQENEKTEMKVQELQPARQIEIQEQESSPKSNKKVDFQTKYADKIMMKKAKNAQKIGNFQGSVFTQATRWLLKEGMGDILDYAFYRSVKLALIGSYHVPNLLLHQLQSQLNQTKFSFIRKAEDEMNLSSNRKDAKYYQELHHQSFLQMESELKYQKGEILVISGDDDLLSIARNHGYYTCRYSGGNNVRYGSVTTDFHATKSIEIKDAIDDLIGIALRSSVSGFNTR